MIGDEKEVPASCRDRFLSEPEKTRHLSPKKPGLPSSKNLNEGLSGFDGVRDDVASLVYSLVYDSLHLFPGSLDGLLGLVAETLGLLLEVVTGIFEVISRVFNALTQLPASFDAALGSVEESNGGSSRDSNTKGQPVVVLCTHAETSSLISVSYCFLFHWIQAGCDWLVFSPERGTGTHERNGRRTIVFLLGRTDFRPRGRPIPLPGEILE